MEYTFGHKSQIQKNWNSIKHIFFKAQFMKLDMNYSNKIESSQTYGGWTTYKWTTNGSQKKLKEK